MAEHGKRHREVSDTVDRERSYQPTEAIDLAKQSAVAKFDEKLFGPPQPVFEPPCWHGEGADAGRGQRGRKMGVICQERTTTRGSVSRQDPVIRGASRSDVFGKNFKRSSILFNSFFFSYQCISLKWIFIFKTISNTHILSLRLTLFSIDPDFFEHFPIFENHVPHLQTLKHPWHPMPTFPFH